MVDHSNQFKKIGKGNFSRSVNVFLFVTLIMLLLALL